MRRWKNDLGDWVTDILSYYVLVGEDEHELNTEEAFGTNLVGARMFARKQSLVHKIVEVRAEGWIPDPAYSAPVYHWSERYENGKMVCRLKWR